MSTIDHIGIAVRSLAERRKLYEALGLEFSAEETVAEQKVRVAFLPVEGPRLELLEPTPPAAPPPPHDARLADRRLHRETR